MKNSIYISSAVTTLLLATSISANASSPADKVTVCPSNDNLTLFEWKKLDGKQNVKEYRQWNQPYTSQLINLKDSNVITVKEYNSLCKETKASKKQPMIQQESSPKQNSIK